MLAGNLKDAVNVCSHQLKDIQLAVAIARVYEGDDGAVLQELLQEKVLPQAAIDGDRWLATWAFWMLKRRDKAVRALIVRNCSHLLAVEVFSTNHNHSHPSSLCLSLQSRRGYMQNLTSQTTQR